MSSSSKIEQLCISSNCVITLNGGDVECVAAGVRPGSRSRSQTAQDMSDLSTFPARFERFVRLFGNTAQTA